MGDRRERLGAGGGDRLRHEPLALERADGAGSVAGAPRDLAREAGERRDPPAAAGALVGQLALVVGDVGRGGHDEPRISAGASAEGIQDDACLRGVGGADDELQGHQLDIVACVADASACRRSAATYPGRWTTSVCV